MTELLLAWQLQTAPNLMIYVFTLHRCESNTHSVEIHTSNFEF